MQTEHYRVSNIKEAVLSKFFNRVCLDWEKLSSFRKGLINLKNLKLLSVIHAAYVWYENVYLIFFLNRILYIHMKCKTRV